MKKKFLKIFFENEWTFEGKWIFEWTFEGKKVLNGLLKGNELLKGMDF
jgi:hypothetical protein